MIISLYHYNTFSLPIHPCINEYLDYLYFLYIVNNAEMNMKGHIPLLMLISKYLYKYTDVRWWHHILILLLIFWVACVFFLRKCTILHSPCSIWGVQFLYLLVNNFYWCCLDNGHLNWYEVIPHHDSHLNFSDNR